MSDDITLRKAAERGILGRCPCCGKGRLFQRFLKQVDNCADCGEAFPACAPTTPRPGPPSSWWAMSSCRWFSWST